MIYQGQADLIPHSTGTRGSSHCIHAQNAGGFHINKKTNPGPNDRVFRYTGLTGDQQKVLRRIAI